jgi:hypothetical protein
MKHLATDQSPKNRRAKSARLRTISPDSESGLLFVRSLARTAASPNCEQILPTSGRPTKAVASDRQLRRHYARLRPSEPEHKSLQTQA